MSAWQSMETAPKDGTNIWAMNHEGQFQAWYDVYLEQWRALVLDVHGCGDCCGGPYPTPTHWRLLPASPLTSDTRTS